MLGFVVYNRLKKYADSVRNGNLGPYYLLDEFPSTYTESKEWIKFVEKMESNWQKYKNTVYQSGLDVYLKECSDEKFILTTVFNDYIMFDTIVEIDVTGFVAKNKIEIGDVLSSEEKFELFEEINGVFLEELADLRKNHAVFFENLNVKRR